MKKSYFKYLLFFTFAVMGVSTLSAQNKKELQKISGKYGLVKLQRVVNGRPNLLYSI